MRVLGSIVVSIPACHAGDRGSIPRRGVVIYIISLFPYSGKDPACHAGDRGSKVKSSFLINVLENSAEDHYLKPGLA